MKQFRIDPNKYLDLPVTAFYHVPYTKMGYPRNPDYLNVLKNTFNNFPQPKLLSASQELKKALQVDLPDVVQCLNIDSLVVCVVPRAKAQHVYRPNQQLFLATVQEVVQQATCLIDGTVYLHRHTNTKTTHLKNTNIKNDGLEPFPGITEQTCDISPEIEGENILLVDDIYTPTVNIDEDAIQALCRRGARTVTFYAVGRVIR